MKCVTKSGSGAKMGPLVLLHVVPTPEDMIIDTALVTRLLAGRKRTHGQKSMQI
jgi:hypothetical protein